jgi:2,4-dienoyl-CoA reductase-like NADH-dependent reductase (Old Yellow Enzyme family)
MSKLFETSRINGMRLPNRFVRSATWEGLAGDDGTCTPEFKDFYLQLAQGGVGLIITSHTFVGSDGQGTPRQLGLHRDKLIPALQDLTRAVHQYKSRIAVELSHAGILTNEKLTGQAPRAVSAAKQFNQAPVSELSYEDIQEIVNAFALAAQRAQKAGFDAVQIHAAHGFLMNQFLSPAFNKRTDDFGGPVENRSRALLDVLRSIRSVVGSGYPILVKLNSDDIIDGGLNIDDAVQVGKMLQDEGIDAIEISGGTIVTGDHCQKDIDTPEKEAYWREAARIFKQNLQVPLILVGGVRSFHLAEQLIEDGYADYISMSRPFIREPDLVNRWASGDRRKATCLSDNLCRGPLMNGGGIYCVVEKQRKEKEQPLINT